MKVIILFIYILVINTGIAVGAAETLKLTNQVSFKKDVQLIAKRSKRRKKSRRSRTKKRSALISALKLAKNKEYEKASIKLFQLSYSPKFSDRKMQIKYILGLMLYKMKLNQVSAFQFISVVKDGKSKYLKQSLENLSLAADYLGDETLLNYAISKVKINSFPKVHRNMLFYRLGEFQFKNTDISGSIRSLNKVRSNSPYYPKAMYLKGLAYAEKNQVKSAVKTFERLIDKRADQKVTDSARVAALIGKARVLYQGKKWNASIEAYRDIPKDTIHFHDMLFESSWAMLRSGKFRSALSNFHSLHSNYYEDYYMPESMLLRSIVYLYICKFDEMEKVLTLFNNIYSPVYKKTKIFLRTKNYQTYYSELLKSVSNQSEKNRIPYVIARKIRKEGDVKNSFDYINKIRAEIKIANNRSRFWRESAIGKYAKKVLRNRLKKAKVNAGKKIKQHMTFIKTELFDLFEQSGFIKFEMLKGKKRVAQLYTDEDKPEKAKKEIDTEKKSEDKERKYYIQNGYEYWPFQGEYWLDEIGNYHYLGKSSCEALTK